MLLMPCAEHSKGDLSPAEKKLLAASLTAANAVEIPVYASLQKTLIKRQKKYISLSLFFLSLPLSILSKLMGLRLAKGKGSTQNKDTIKEKS